MTGRTKRPESSAIQRIARRTRIAVAGLALTAVLLGCGAGDGGPGNEPLTRAEFIEQANTICNAANEVLREAMMEAFPADGKPNNETGIRFTHEIWVPNLRQQLRDLRALEPPAADRPKIEAMLDELSRVTDRVDADPAIASEGPFDRVTRRLTAYGIGPCGSP